MKLDPRILIPAGLAAAAMAVPSSAGAQPSPTPGRCPDNFVPVLAFVATGSQDHNGDGWVCVKGPQGSNQHFNTTDDKDPATFDPTTNTWYAPLSGTAWWVTGNIVYDVTTAQDDTLP